MNVFKNLFNFYINSSIHVALAVYALVRITEMYFGLPYNEPLDYFIFYGTITGYNFVKYAGVAKFHHRSLTGNLKAIQIFSFFCFLAMCYYGYQLSINTLLYCLPFVVLTVLYAIPFLSGFQRNLRNISYLKIIVVSLVWVGFTVIIPLLGIGEKFSLNIFLNVLQRFLLVVVLILPFDIRDVKYDAISLQTIPKKIGVEKTKKMGFILMIITLLIEFVITPNIYFKNVYMLFFVFVILFLMRAKENQPKYYSSFFVEALPIFWWILLLSIHKM